MATPFQFNSQSFSKGIAGNVPFQQNNSLPDIATLNPKYTEFSNATSKRGVALKRHSISTPDILNSGDVAVKAFFSKTNAILYQNANEGKASRLKEYNTLGSMEAVKDALEEIANEFFNVDDKGRLARLNVKGKEDKPETLELLNKEFEKYFGYFQFDEYGPRYLKQFLKEGELFFEQIAHEDYMTQGVLGVEQMSAVLTEPLYINVVTEEMDGFILKRPIYDPKNPNIITGFELIPMSKGQVVYIHSDDWNVEHTFRVPHVDACRKAFRQLSMVEDCILIYRLVNAPERLVFNVDVGNMPAPKAEEYLAQMSQSYWSNRSYDPNKGDVVNQFNPQSTLDAFFFPIRTGSTGSKVEKLPAGCLDMSTKVDLLDGRSLSIREISNELAEGKVLWTYSCNPETGHIQPGIISWAGVTNAAAKVMEITLDNGEKIVCTLDHKFPIPGKGFVRADELVSGDSMTPFYKRGKKLGKSEYEQIYQNDTRSWEFTHRMVANSFNKELCKTYIFDDAHASLEKNVVHHADFNRFNNSPENLLWMNWYDHTALHNSKSFPPMVGSIKAKAIIEDMKLNDPDGYDIWKEKVISAIKKWRKDSPQEEIDAMYERQAISVKKYIDSLSVEKKATRAENSRKAFHKATEVKLAKLASDPLYNDFIYKKVSAAHKARFAAMTAEERSAYFNKVDVQRKLNPTYVDTKKKFALNQSITFPARTCSVVVSLLKEGKNGAEILKAMNADSAFMLEFLSLNADKNIKNWDRKSFKHTHLQNIAKAAGYGTFRHMKKDASVFNHKIVSIKLIDETMEVGTLTIDNDEKYHNFHTFALSCGVFTKNSNLGELQDLQYFAQKLYKSLKVPTSRLQSDNTYRDGTDILREELKFANYIIDLQKQFARGIKLGFIAHLRLRGYLSKFDIKESDMTIKFNPPTNFFEMRESKRKEGNISNYQNITSDGYVSKTKAIMDEMKWSPEDVLANLEQRRRDAAIEWEIEQIRAAGPRWAELGGAAGAPGGAPPAPGGGGGGGGGIPPSFSGGPVDTEGGMGEADGAGEVPAAGANPVGQPELAETGSEDVDTGEPEVPQPV